MRPMDFMSPTELTATTSNETTNGITVIRIALNPEGAERCDEIDGVNESRASPTRRWQRPRPAPRQEL